MKRSLWIALGMLVVLALLSTGAAGFLPARAEQSAEQAAASDAQPVIGGRGCDTPSFQQSANFKAPFNVFSLVSGDFNNDAIPDLAAAGLKPGEMALFLGDGSGGFHAPSLVNVGRAEEEKPKEPPSGWGNTLAVGDFNRDGKLDLVRVHVFNKVELYLGDGAGHFAAPVSVGSWDAPLSVAAADFNKDGKLDLAVGVRVVIGWDLLAVVMGNGDGSFRSPVETEVQDFPSFLALQDFNRDGNPDLLATSTGTFTKYGSLLLGRGDGHFDYKRWDEGDPGVQLADATGDLNYDGRPDAVVTSVGIIAGEYLGSLLGEQFEHSRPFQLVLKQRTGQDFWKDHFFSAPAVGDVNGDGLPDILSAEWNGTSFSVFKGKGDGGFVTPGIKFSVGGQGGLALALADYNRDGKPLDAAVGLWDGTIGVQLNTCGAFEKSMAGTARLIEREPDPIANLRLGEFFHNGKPGFAYNYTAGGLADKVAFTQGDGNGGFISAAFTSSLLAKIKNVLVGDLNRDGFLDFVTFGEDESQRKYAYTARGQDWSSFAEVEASRLEFGSQVFDAGLLLADFNRDGNPDLATSDESGGLQIFLGKGDMTFLPGIPVNLGFIPFTIVSGDFNHDGKPDLAAGRSDSTQAAVLLGNGNGSFSAPYLFTPCPAAGGLTTSRLAAADFNRDGKDDLALVNSASQGDQSVVCTLVSDGSGGFSDQYAARSLGMAVDMAPGDLNQDGRLDLVLLHQGQSMISVLLGKGDGSMTPTAQLPTFPGPTTLLVNDFNLDGRQDLVVGSTYFQDWYRSRLAIHLGDSNGMGQPTRSELASNLNPANYGDVVTFTVSLSSPIGLPDSGLVSLQDQGVTISTTQASSGEAVFETVNLAVGTHQLTAVYAGNDVFGGSTSPVIEQKINGNTRVILVAEPNPSIFGDMVTFTATVKTTPGTPPGPEITGTVTFLDGMSVLGTVDLSSEKAVFSLNTLGVGTHPVAALYNGNPTYNPSVSPYLDLLVIGKPTTTSLTSSLNPSEYGQAVTLTVHVDGQGAGIPSGVVTILDGETTLITQTLVNGDASTSTSHLLVGAHKLKAEYSGDSTFNASSSPVVVQHVMGGTRTTLVSAPNPSNLGEAVTFTAEVALTERADPGDVLTGTVTFLDGEAFLAQVPLVNNQASLVTDQLVGGLHSIQARYSGDPNSHPSQSDPVDQLVIGSETSTTLVSAPNPSIYGTPAVFTATVSSNLFTPSGVVELREGSITRATGELAEGQVVFTLNNLAVGMHHLTANYLGNAAFRPSQSSVLDQHIIGNTNTSLESSLNPSLFNQDVTFIAVVTITAGEPQGNGLNGEVYFMDGVVPMAILPLSNGQAQFTTHALDVGTHPIVAVYSGDEDSNPSQSLPVDQQVVGAPASVFLVSSLNPAEYGQAVNFSITVLSNVGTPGGQVLLKDGGTTIDSGTLVDGKITFTHTDLAPGVHPLVAEYQGDDQHQPAVSPELAQNVTAQTATRIESAPNPSDDEQQVTLTARVSAAAGVPGGQVRFEDQARTLGTASLSNGVATLEIKDLEIGEHSLRGIYLGDGSYQSSMSAPVKHIVRGNVSIAQVSSGNPALVDSQVTFTATVDASGAHAPTGQVSFWDGISPLGSANLVNGKAALSSQTLSAGGHVIRAVYEGDANYNQAYAPELEQVMFGYAAYTSLDGSPNPAQYGQWVTFTIQVTSNVGLPIGSVELVENGEVLGRGELDNGTALVSLNTLASGHHYLSAVYLGDAAHNPSFSNRHYQLVQGNTSISLASSPNPSTYGQEVTFALQVSSTQGGAPFTGWVSLFDREHNVGLKQVGENGAATFNLSDLAVGTHDMRAFYSGDVVYHAASSDVKPQVVKGIDTSTTLAGAPNPSNFNQVVNFSVMVASPVGPAPSGVVRLKEGENVLAQVLLSNGTANILYQDLPAGWHSLAAEYTGDATHNGSQSPAWNQHVLGNTQTVLQASSDQSRLGEAVTFTASVQRQSATDALAADGLEGTVMFLDGMAPLASITLTNGSAAFTTDQLGVGEHTLTAIYSGDSDDNPSQSNDLGHKVIGRATVVSLNANPNPSTYPQAVEFTVQVNSDQGTPTGKVRLVENNLTLLYADLVDGTARFSYDGLQVGQHLLRAVFDASGDYSGGESPVWKQQVKGNTSVLLFSSGNPAGVGQQVVFTAKILANGGGTPTGLVAFLDGATWLKLAEVNNGQATFSTSSLSVGTHRIWAVYSGDNTSNPSISPEMNQVILGAPVTVQLSSAPNPANFGDTVQFQVSVSTTVGLAQGTVRLMEGETERANGTLSNGQASFNLADLAVGSHTLRAEYLGDGVHNPGISPVLRQQVNGNTSTTLVSSVNQTDYNDPVVFTATVSRTGLLLGGEAALGGSITFLDGWTVIAVIPVVDGRGVYSTTGFSVGEHTLLALYSGDTDDNPSQSNAVGHVVNGRPTATSLESSPNPSIIGEMVAFTATVSSDLGTPEGRVQLVENGQTLLTSDLVDGTARFNHAWLPVGHHLLRAVFEPQGVYAGSFSPEMDQHVTGNTRVQLISSVNPSHYSQEVSFTALVVQTGGGTPSGNVTLLDGMTPLDTKALAEGQVTFDLSTLEIGEHGLVALYEGDDDSNPSQSPVLLQEVLGAPVQVTLESAPNPSNYGQNVEFAAAVKSSEGTPQGWVLLKEGEQVLAFAELTTGQVRIELDSLEAGQHTLVAEYLGDETHSPGSSSSYGQRVAGNSTTTLTSTLNPARYAQEVTLEAAVSKRGGGAVPTGSVTYVDGDTVLAVVPLAEGRAVYTSSDLAVGSHPVSAVYSGDAQTNPSISLPLLQVIEGDASIVTLRSSPNPANYGLEVAFTIQVTSPVGIPGGVVAIIEGDWLLAVADLVDGQAQIEISGLRVGEHILKAVYAGDETHNAAESEEYSQRITGNTSLELSISQNQATWEDTVVLTATLTWNGGGNPAGQVVFVTGAVPLAFVDLVDGKAVWAWKQPWVGAMKITALYLGDEQYHPSQSNPVNLVVREIHRGYLVEMRISNLPTRERDQ
jgi:hypothetical protein